MIISGWIYSGVAFGWEGLGWSLVGTVIGLALLLPAYAIGGMGAGDVKLLAGVGSVGLWHAHFLRLLRFRHRRSSASCRDGSHSQVVEETLESIHGDPERDFGNQESKPFVPRSQPNAKAQCCSCLTEFQLRSGPLVTLDGSACWFDLKSIRDFEQVSLSID